MKDYDKYNEEYDTNAYYDQSYEESYYVEDTSQGDGEWGLNEKSNIDEAPKGKGTIILCLLMIIVLSIVGYLGNKYLENQGSRIEIASEYIIDFETELNTITSELNEILEGKFKKLEEEDVEYFEVLGEIIDSYYPFKERLNQFRNDVTEEGDKNYVSIETQKDMLRYIDNTIEEIDQGLIKSVSEIKELYGDILSLYTEDESIESLAKSIQNIENTIELLETSSWSEEYLSEVEFQELYTTATTMLQSKETTISKLINYIKAEDNGIICYSTITQEAAMLEKVNALRKSNGLNTLYYDSSLFDIAKIRGIEITELFSHTRPDGSDCLTVDDDMAGENISCNNEDFSVEASYKQFYDSIGHRDNMLYANYTRFACNRVIANGSAYWVQIFGF